SDSTLALLCSPRAASGTGQWVPLHPVLARTKGFIVPWLTVREGDEFTFEYSMKGDRMANYFMYWYRRGPRGSLEWICRGRYSYGECFQDRFKGRVENSQNNYTLQLLSAELGDAATYYCGAELPWSNSAAE
uniref:Ig-like domain-containing protein n=1 Tax=Zonotrichia albicollis TaxID=44394 RepID=A0A8D2M5D0_ZONAL